MFSKKNKKVGVVMVWILTIGLILTYVPLIFSPDVSEEERRVSEPESRQVVVPLTLKDTSSSTTSSSEIIVPTP